ILPPLLPSLKDITLSPPGCPWPTAQAFDLPSFLELSQYPTYHVSTDAWAGTLQIGEGKLSDKGVNGRFDQPCLCPTRRFHLPGACLELTISTAQDHQEIIEPGQEIVPSFMPPF